MEVVAVVMVFLSQEQNQTIEYFSRPTVDRFGRLMSSALHFGYGDIHKEMTGCVSLGAAGGWRANPETSTSGEGARAKTARATGLRRGRESAN